MSSESLAESWGPTCPGPQPPIRQTWCPWRCAEQSARAKLLGLKAATSPAHAAVPPRPRSPRGSQSMTEHSRVCRAAVLLEGPPQEPRCRASPGPARIPQGASPASILSRCQRLPNLFSSTDRMLPNTSPASDPILVSASVTESKPTLLGTRQASKPRDEVLGQGLYSESPRARRWWTGDPENRHA